MKLSARYLYHGISSVVAAYGIERKRKENGMKAKENIHCVGMKSESIGIISSGNIAAASNQSA